MDLTRRRLLGTTLIATGLPGCLGESEDPEDDGAGDGGTDDAASDGDAGSDDSGSSDDGESQDDGSSDDGEGDDGDGHDHAADAVDEPSQSAEVAMASSDGHHFEPHLVWIEPGGTVTWRLESGAHTATAYHADNDRPDRTPADAESWDSGILAETDATFERTFDVEGVYDYFCSPHESMGMVGSVIVGEPDPHEQPGLAEPQDELPEEAASMLTDLNAAANETLGHTHD